MNRRNPKRQSPISNKWIAKRSLIVENSRLKDELEEVKKLLLEAKYTCYMGAGSDGKSIWLIPCETTRGRIMEFLNR
jgi:hypothetical protein